MGERGLKLFMGGTEESGDMLLKRIPNIYTSVRPRDHYFTRGLNNCHSASG